MAIGAGLGAAIGYVRYRVHRDRNDLTRSGLRADTYQIQVDARNVDPERAEHRLAQFWPA